MYSNNMYDKYIASEATLTKGLVGYWKMDEASWNGTAGEVIDSSGSGDHGVGLNGVSVTTGKFGNAGNFDGTDDYVSITKFQTKNSIRTETLSVWIKMIGASNSALLGTLGNNGTDNHQMIIYTNSSNVWCDGSFNIGNLSTGGVATISNQWEHFVCVVEYIDGIVTAKLYKNGSFITKSSIAASAYLNDSNRIHIGAQKPFVGRYFNGQIDEARIYNRALNPDEVTTLYQWGPPVAYWKMNEGQGSIISDSSGNNTGTFVNTPTWVNGKYDYAINFDGVDDYISAGTINLGATSTTVSMWVKTNSVKTNMYLFGGWESGGPKVQYTISVVTLNKANIYTDTSGVRISSVRTINDSLWHYLSYVYNKDNLQMYLYVDGVLEASGNAGSVTWNNWKLNIGCHTDVGINCATNSQYAGLVDEVKVYNYARTQDQILKDMENR